MNGKPGHKPGFLYCEKWYYFCPPINLINLCQSVQSLTTLMEGYFLPYITLIINN